MAYTKKKYRDSVIELGSSYGVEIRLSKSIIDRAVQRAIDEVYRRLVPKRPSIWEKTATLNDGDPLPADFISFVDAYYLLSSVPTGFRYTPIPEWAGVKNNTAVIAVANDPAFALWDHALHTAPSINTISFVYNAKPKQLYVVSAQPADTTLSDMPEDCDQLVVRGAFERITVFMSDDKTAMTTTQEALDRIQKANFEYYTENLERLLEGGNDATVR